MSKKILITGATGNIGKALAAALSAQNASYVLAARNTSKARQALGDKVELVELDFDRPETFAAATQNIDKVFLMGPPLVANLDEMLSPFIDHLKKQNIQRLVYLAAFGFENVKALPFHENTIKKIADAGFDYTILKPSFFAQNFKNFEWENIMERNITYAPAGDGKVAFVDVNDIARVGAVALTKEGYSKKVLEITGPELLSFADAANLLSEVTGKKVVYPNPSAAEYKQTLLSAGAPAFIGDYMAHVYSAIEQGYVNRKTTTVKEVTGVEPASLKSVLERDFSN